MTGEEEREERSSQVDEVEGRAMDKQTSDAGEPEGRRGRRGAWGRRKHAATEEATAYRVVRADSRDVCVCVCPSSSVEATSHRLVSVCVCARTHAHACLYLPVYSKLERSVF